MREDGRRALRLGMGDTIRWQGTSHGYRRDGLPVSGRITRGGEAEIGVRLGYVTRHPVLCIRWAPRDLVGTVVASTTPSSWTPSLMVEGALSFMRILGLYLRYCRGGS